MGSGLGVVGESISRVSVGLEEREAMLETFLMPIRVVDESDFGQVDLAGPCTDDIAQAAKR